MKKEIQEKIEQINEEYSDVLSRFDLAIPECNAMRFHINVDEFLKESIARGQNMDYYHLDDNSDDLVYLTDIEMFKDSLLSLKRAIFYTRDMRPDDIMKHDNTIADCLGITLEPTPEITAGEYIGKAWDEYQDRLEFLSRDKYMNTVNVLSCV